MAISTRTTSPTCCEAQLLDLTIFDSGMRQLADTTSIQREIITVKLTSAVPVASLTSQIVDACNTTRRIVDLISRKRRVCISYVCCGGNKPANACGRPTFHQKI
jgi:hypothetical protein